jgi:hypothetical protein
MPKEEHLAFLKEYHALEDTKFEIERFVNDCNGERLSGRQLRVLFLLTKCLAHTDSLLNIIQNRFQYRIDQKMRLKWRKTRFYPFDHHSICALGRVCYDAGLMVHYLSEPTLNLSQWNLRRKVLYLHDLANRKRFLKAANKIAEDEVEDDAGYGTFSSGIKDDILMHLGELEIEVKPEFTSGQMVFVQGIRGAVREAGWDVNAFEFQQVYLSNFIHSHPVSFMRASEHHVDFENPSPAQYAAALVAVSIAHNSASSSLRRCVEFIGDGGDPLADCFDDDGLQIDARGNL